MKKRFVILMLAAAGCVELEPEILTDSRISEIFEICDVQGSAAIQEYLIAEIEKGGGVHGTILGSEIDLEIGRFSLDVTCGKDCTAQYVMQIAPASDDTYFVCYLHHYANELFESEALLQNAQAMPTRYAHQYCFVDQYDTCQGKTVEKIRYLATNECGGGINLKRLLPVVTFWEPITDCDQKNTTDNPLCCPPA